MWTGLYFALDYMLVGVLVTAVNTTRLGLTDDIEYGLRSIFQLI